MGQIVLKTNNSKATLVSNAFIDNYMASANEAQIKIYLYLLRCIGDNIPISVSSIADTFNYIEKDVLRALIYLEKKKLLSIEFDEDENVVGIFLNDCEAGPASGVSAGMRPPAAKQSTPKQEADKANSEPVPIATTHFYPVDKLNEFKSDDRVQQLLFMTEFYMKKPLSVNDTNTLLFIYEELHFPVDLIEHLVEYCVDGGNRSIKYIETVAISWAEQGIKTVEEARAMGSSSKYYKEGYAVLRELGITSRSVVAADLEYITRWIDEYGMDMELILEGCRRTILAISKPSFNYTNSILSNWHDAGIKSFSDISRADESFNADKKAKSSSRSAAKKDAFKNFTESDNNYNEIARSIMQAQGSGSPD